MKSEKPKILYLINSLVVGGAEAGLANMISRGVFAEFDLSVLTIWKPSDEFLSWKPRVHDHYIGNLINGERGAAGLLRALIKLTRIIRTLEPKIIIASLPQSVVLARFARLLFPRIKVITFEHNERLGSPVATALFRISSWLSSAFWSDSEVTTYSVRRRHWYRQGTPSCIVSLQDLEDCLSMPSPEYTPDALPLLFVGRLTPQKNIVRTVEAVAIARGRGVPVTLDIVGGGSLINEVNDLIGASGLHEQIKVHGSRVDWPQVFGGKGYIGVLASEREGLSITGLQLLALGFPLISTGSGEVGRYLKAGINGVHVLDCNTTSIADALESAWSMRNLWREMSQAARRSAIVFDDSIETPKKDALAQAMLKALAV